MQSVCPHFHVLLLNICDVAGSNLLHGLGASCLFTCLVICLLCHHLITILLMAYCLQCRLSLSERQL